MSAQLPDAETDEVVRPLPQVRTNAAAHSYRLDSVPYPSTSSTPAGWTLTTSDKMGRVAAVQTYPGGTSGMPAPWGAATAYTGNATAAYNQTSPSCSGPAEIVTVDGAPNNVRTYCGDGLGRMRGVQDAAPVFASYTYDLLNNLTGVTMGSQTRAFNYSSLSRLMSATNPESRTVQYTYDFNGNLTSQTDARSTTVSFAQYDALNRPTSKTYSGGTAAATSQVTYAYDADFRGALSSVSNGNSTTTYTHDGFGRITGSTQTPSGGPTYTFIYAYNPIDQLTQVTYPSGRSVVYNLDSAGRVSSVQNGATSANYASSIQTQDTHGTV